MRQLEVVYNEFEPELRTFGEVVLAGGSVRDVLRGKTPKDYDVFCLYRDDWNWERVKEELGSALTRYEEVQQLEWHQSEPYLVATIKMYGYLVQVMGSPKRSVDELLDTFDWNVTLFSYNGEVKARTSIDQIGYGKYLELQTVTFPLSTLRRGFRFSERFSMRLHREDILRLCKETVEKQAPRGPQGA